MNVVQAYLTAYGAALLTVTAFFGLLMMGIILEEPGVDLDRRAFLSALIVTCASLAGSVLMWHAALT